MQLSIFAVYGKSEVWLKGEIENYNYIRRVGLQINITDAWESNDALDISDKMVIAENKA
ncbi:MAG: hypothetical protein ACJ72T_03640 [Nitrososphaeraceae archaeon]